jgi:threonine/homoserine/homoserine lactone efflux protein
MIQDWLPNLIAAWCVQLLGVFSPGPGVALIMAQATSRGRGAALSTCLGIAFGAVLLAIATVLGLAALFSDIAWAMTVVKLIGVGYLSWLAWKSLSRAVTPSEVPVASAQVSGGASVFAGFAMQITNPKAIFFWLAVAALGSMDAAPMPVVLVFLAGAFLNSFVGHGAWAVALSSRPFLSLYGAARRWIEGALGVFFGFAAFKLATSRN